MKKLIFILFGFFILILTMWLLNTWQSGNWEENLSQNVLPKLKTIESGESPRVFSSTSSDYKEFASPDGKLKINYPASWLAVENQGLFAATAPKEWQEKYDLKTIFLTQYLNTGKFAQLIIQEGIFNIPTEKIIEEMKKINQEQGSDMKIVQSDIQDDEAVFEAEHSMANSPSLYSKEKIILVGEKTYLIAFITLEKDWQAFAQEANVILESVKTSL